MNKMAQIGTPIVKVQMQNGQCVSIIHLKSNADSEYTASSLLSFTYLLSDCMKRCTEGVDKTFSYSQPY